MLNAGIQPFHCVLAHFPPPLPLFSHPQPVLFYFVLLTTRKKWNIKLSAEGNALKISPPFCAPLWVYKIFPGVKVEQGVERKIWGGWSLFRGVEHYFFCCLGGQPLTPRVGHTYVHPARVYNFTTHRDHTHSQQPAIFSSSIFVFSFKFVSIMTATSQM